MDNRREFLKKSALLSGAAAFSGSLPASIQRAFAINPLDGSTYLDAEHVVILMQENRSFDHCFGSMRGVRGFNDPRAITLPNKNLVWLQSNKAGDTYAPFHFDIKETKITWMGDIPHNRSSQVDAYNSGKHDKWLDSKRSGNKKYADMPITLGHYSRSDLPFNYSMADAFTVCDQHFCSAMTSTWPNRLYLWGGTIRAEKSEEAKAYINNSIPYGEAHWKTFPERLEENDITWKVYQNDISAGGGFVGEERAWLSNFGCNPLEFLSQYNVRFSSRYVQSLRDRIESLPTEISVAEKKLVATASTEEAYKKLQIEIEKKNEVLEDSKTQLEKWSKENFEKLSAHQKNIYRRAFITNEGDADYHRLAQVKYKEEGIERELMAPKGDVLYQFRKDVDSGELPTVSWLVPSQNLSDHPSAPWYGAWLTSEILDILTKNPEVWKKTIFILTYDENDGYFDHQPPFVAPDPKDTKTGRCSPGINVTGVEYIRSEREIQQGISEKQARSGPIGLGFRVPMIIASPWSRGGKVCSQVFDHTSSLQFLENFVNAKFKKNIREENISQWRRTICGNLTAAFTKFDEKQKEAVLFLERDPFLEKIYNAKFKEEPTGFKKLSDAEIAAINIDPSKSGICQEPGVRPANPLPYQLHADSLLSADHKMIEIKMSAQNEVFGESSSGSPFIVYAPGEYISLEAEKKNEQNFEAVRTWHYAVAAGESLTEQWPLNAFRNNEYHLRFYGPNGFFRELAGNVKDPQLHIHCDYERSRLLKSKLSGNVELKIMNQSADKDFEIEIIDNAYKNKNLSKKISPSAAAVIILSTSKTFGWYDFSIRVKGNNSFMKRFAGRVETGKESFSDPFMGKV
ncbi:MAG: phospholipase C, phosphocholine-specific [Ginsengibacter sp.]